MSLEKQLERQEKITAGLKKAYERMLEFKRYKKSALIIDQDGRIMQINP